MRVVYCALVWMVLWGAVLAMLSFVIGFIDPGVIGPGEGPIDFARIAGWDGLLTGAAFGLVLLAFERRRRVADIPLLRAMLWGILTAVTFRVLAITDVFLSNSGTMSAISAVVCVLLARNLPFRPVEHQREEKPCSWTSRSSS